MKAAMRAPIKPTRGQRDYVRREQTKVAQCNASGSRTRAMKAVMRAPIETTRGQRDHDKRKQNVEELKMALRREQTKVAQCNASGSRTRAMKAVMRAPIETTRGQRDYDKRKRTLEELKTANAILMCKNKALVAEIANLRGEKKIEGNKAVKCEWVGVGSLKKMQLVNKQSAESSGQVPQVKFKEEKF
jgi:hypothetical protein